MSAIVEQYRAKIGERVERTLGTVDALMIKKYARAVGDDNPLYFDPHYARQHGYDDIIAPPNLVSSVFVWNEGKPEPDLRPDGLDPDYYIIPIPDSYRVMGGGQRLEITRPVYPGTDLHAVMQLDDLYEKGSSIGQLLFLVTTTEFYDQRDQLLLVKHETMILAPPVEDDNE